MADIESRFGDEFPSELRIRIFGYVLKSEVAVTRLDCSGQEYPQPRRTHENLTMTDQRRRFRCHRINTSLFLVNKTFSKESMDAFYQVNMIRFRDDCQLHDPLPGGMNMLSLIRRAEFHNAAKNWLFWAPAVPVSSQSFDQAWRMPKLQSRVVIWDHRFDGHYAADMRSYVRDFGDFGNLRRATDLKCINIGHYALSNRNSRHQSDMHLQYKWLMQDWQEMQTGPQPMDPVWKLEADVLACIAASRIEPEIFSPEALRKHITSHKLRYNMPLFVALRDLVEQHVNGIAVLPVNCPATEVIHWFTALHSHTSLMLSLLDLQVQPVGCRGPIPLIRDFDTSAGRTPVRDLGPGSDSDELEWATEMLRRYVGPRLILSGDSTLWF